MKKVSHKELLRCLKITGQSYKDWVKEQNLICANMLFFAYRKLNHKKKNI